MDPDAAEAYMTEIENAEANKRGIIVRSLLASGEASCDLCGDLRWVRKQLPVTDPNFGKMLPCECQHFDRASRWVSVTAGATAVKAYTFESFRLSLNPGMADVVDAAKAFIGEGAPPWLAIVGPNGTGKTHLAISACRLLVGAGWNIAYYTGPGALDALKATMDRKPEEQGPGYDDVMWRLQNSPLLFMDEMDMVKRTEWAVERLEQILTHRFQLRLRTVLVANRLEDFGKRLESRIQDRRTCRLALCARKTEYGLVWADDVRPRLRAVQP